MINTIPISLGNASNDLVQADSRKLVNMYAESSSGKTDFIIRKRPGLGASFAHTGSFAMRGLYETSTNRLFGVRGNDLFEVSTFNTTTQRGVLGTSFGPVSMTDNGIDMVIADGTNLYKYVLSTNTLSIITDANAPSNTPKVECIDGYVFGFDPDATEIGEYKYSELDLDGGVDVWPVLNNTIAEKSPDKLVSMIANNGDLWLFGSKSYEIHSNTGQLTNTFAVINGTAKEIGCAAVNSVAKIGGSIFWLGASREGHAQVFMSVGYGAQKISTFNEDSRISDLGQISDAIGFTYQYKGHSFYLLTFQNGDLSLQYDILTNTWHDLTSYNMDTNLQSRYRQVCHAFFNGKNYFGDIGNGDISTLGDEFYTDNGRPIICEMTFPYIDNMGQPFSIWSLQLDVQTGVGLTGEDEPVLEYCYSNDGVNFSQWRDVGIGAIGEVFKRVKINKLSNAKFGKRVFKIRYSEPTKFNVLNKTLVEV